MGGKWTAELWMAFGVHLHAFGQSTGDTLSVVTGARTAAAAVFAAND